MLKKTPPLIAKPENASQLLTNEIAVYGFVLSYQHLHNFINDHQQEMTNKNVRYFSLKSIQAESYGKYDTAVVVENVQHLQSRKGKKIAFLQVSDCSASFSKLIALASCGFLDRFSAGQLICLKISISKQMNQKSFFVEKVFFAA